MVRIFDHAIHPFINFARDIGGPFPVLVFRQIPEQRPVAMFGHLFLHVGDQSFHNLGMKRHVPGFVSLDRATRLAIIFTDKQEPLPRYDFLGIAIAHEIEIEGAAIDDLGHPAPGVRLHQ